MTTLEKDFPQARFTPEVVREALDKLEHLAADWSDHNVNKTNWDEQDRNGPWTSASHLAVTLASGERWVHDSLSAFFADVRKPASTAILEATCWYTPKFGLRVDLGEFASSVLVRAPEVDTVLELMEVFDSHASDCAVPKPPLVEPPAPRVFIGHGGSSKQWMDLQNHLEHLHSYSVEAFETGARAGHHIRDVLERMLDVSSLALLVLTAEDEQADGAMRARQNVVHEAGLFQGRLGYSRAILLIEDGVEEFSNAAGVQHIPFPRGQIRAAFGDVLAVLRREFGRP
ncbi:TIR domain-containing protein [Cellulomonas sp. PSBB021]|uniref:TIR domain-containing protein n=1 Tax=Cellulomonas sp. PSBB021 TaxID=2003551 RepID=UPI000B8DB0F1|nr:nucleotide-binding protein [Cellulomonas sp. PSBB021]ASR55881.1 hypothetical protein CBP52_13110 [Cellulomonas sp. PSBB021]